MVTFNFAASSSAHIIWDRSGGRAEQDCACPAEPPTFKAENRRTLHETDCACAEAIAFSPTIPPAPASVWQRSPDLYRAPLTDQHTLFFNPRGNAGVIVLNELAAALLDVFAAPATAIDAFHSLQTLPLDVVRTAADSLQSLGLLQPSPLPAFCPDSMSETLTAWLHVTARCNLACPYCYTDKDRRSMSSQIGRRAVDALFRSAQANGFRAVKFKYAGGEPTLAFPVVQEIHRHARQIAEKSGIALRSVLLSNGVALTDRMLAWMVESDVRLMISLDGIGAIHDRQRPQPNGEGSFSKVSRVIDRAQSMGLSPHLSTTITAYNVADIADVVAFALERDLFFNLNFVRPNFRAPQLMPSPTELIAGVRTALRVIESRLPKYRLIDGMLDRCITGVPHTHPCGAGRSYLVIDPAGQLARCHMKMDRLVGSIWDPHPLDAIRQSTVGFRNVAVNEKEDCRICQWRYICAGGCPILSQGQRSPYCAVYQALLPELLRLEGLRLLKWHIPDC